MAKYILTLFKVEDDYALQPVIAAKPYSATAIAYTRYAILDSTNESNKDTIALIDSIINCPGFASDTIISMGEWESFKDNVRSVLAGENPAPEISEDDLLVIYNHFCEEMDHSCERDIYSDTLRDVLFKHGYKPEWEE